MNIGFLDYQLTNYHYKKFYSILSSTFANDAKVVAANEHTPSEEGQKWATDNGIPYLATPEEVIAASDALIVLAPNNPERHLELARPALASGKPVFIDKMLAHNTADAKQIIDLAAASGTPIMSSSSLRFAVELDELDKRIQAPIEGLFARGMGKFPIYAVHTITMALRYYGPKVTRVIDTGVGPDRTLTLDNGTMRATVELRDCENQYEASPWQVGIRTGGKYEIATMQNSDAFYENMMRHALEFFRTRQSPITTDEQLANVQIQEAAEKSQSAGGQWVEIK